MIKELFIKISLCILMLTAILVPVFLSTFISIWFLFGWCLFPFSAALSIDYCETHNESSFLNFDIDF